MEDSLDNNTDFYLEHDSLSSDDFSNDSLLNGNHIENLQDYPIYIQRRGSYTLETSPKANANNKTQHLTQSTYSQAGINRWSLMCQSSSNYYSSQKSEMTQSMYERPWVTSDRSNVLSSANAKQREEKIRLAKEEQERKQKQRMAELNESEKNSQNARRRKEMESQRKLEEKKTKEMEKQRIVEERKERLKKAEEERKKAILKKLINTDGQKTYPNSSYDMMTMSCHAGFVSSRSKHGKLEVVHNRTKPSRPVSSTGSVIAFGSSTPRPICQIKNKLNSENKNISKTILEKCEILSRPLSSRIPERMISSVIIPHISNTLRKKPQRQGSLKEKNSSKRLSLTSVTSTSMADHKITLRSESSVKGNRNVLQRKKNDSKVQDNTNFKSSEATINKMKKLDETTLSKKVSQSKSATLNKKNKKSNVDHVWISEKLNNIPKSIIKDKDINSLNFDRQENRTKIENSFSSGNEESNLQAIVEKPLIIKDISEAEYREKLLENRRLVREKREREREMLIKLERDRRHAEEIATREMMGIDRDKSSYIEESNFTTSNDDALDGNIELKEKYINTNDFEESQFYQISKNPSITVIDQTFQSNKDEEEKNERKKKLNSIMSRIRKTNEESSSDGGMSPRRTLSPEPVEIESDMNMITTPAFRSSLLQSMVNKGRLSKTINPTKDYADCKVKEDVIMSSMLTTTGIALSSVRESMEDSESQPTTRNSPSSVAIRSSGIEGNSLSDANSEFAPEPFLEKMETNEDDTNEKESTLGYVNPDIDREDCDGKEDSLSLNENIGTQEYEKMNILIDFDNCSSVSSVEEEVNDTSIKIALC